MTKPYFQASQFSHLLLAYTTQRKTIPLTVTHGKHVAIGRMPFDLWKKNCVPLFAIGQSCIYENIFSFFFILRPSLLSFHLRFGFPEELTWKMRLIWFCASVCFPPVSHLLSGGGENGGLWLVLFGWAAANKSQCNIEAATEAMGQTGSPSCASERAWARLVWRLKHTPDSNPRKKRGRKREWRLKRER